jgi:uncharacterized membrane protein
VNALLWGGRNDDQRGGGEGAAAAIAAVERVRAPLHRPAPVCDHTDVSRCSRRRYRGAGDQGPRSRAFSRASMTFPWMQTMTGTQAHKVHLSHEDLERLRELRAQKPARVVRKPVLTRGAALADWVAETVGSWRFIMIQSVVLAIWIALNLVAAINHWDPYPFILLNLVLSFQAAYAAPIIMMSQNRQSEIDRRHAEHDYRINVKAELEIELLHNKIDALREQEIVKLLDIIERLSAHLAPGLLAAIEAEAAPKG